MNRPPCGLRHLLLGCLLSWPLVASVLVASVHAQGSAATYTHVVPIEPTDRHEQVIAKAASLVPNRAQQLYYLDEFSAFIHFGPNTFSGVEWGNGMEDPQIFDPGNTLDTDQWCRILKDAGMRKVILTAKHHDGFCLWQSRYNSTFSVRATAWRGGKGDVLRELADSCRKHGLKLGIYLSPADLYHIENTEHGLYGNGSSARSSVIPTALESFHTDPTIARGDRPADKPTFHVTVDDYNRYFMNQLYEVLTEYGPIHEVWFDGAHPKRKGGQTYAKQEWFRMIRSLAPDAAIFGGPDIRWCGNEGGRTREAEWSVLPTESEEVSGEDRPDDAPGSDEALTAKEYQVYGKPYAAKELRFLIAEVNTSIREGWFWRNETEQSVRGPDDVFDIYERAVGGNANFLLNVPPDRTGRIAPRDAACLAEVGKRIRETYAQNLLPAAAAKTTAPQVLDLDLATFWQPTTDTGELVISFPAQTAFNRLVLQEAIFTVGQRIRQYAVDAWLEGAWQEIGSGTTVGYKRIVRFPTVTTDRLRVRVLSSRLAPTLAEVSVHRFQQPPLPVAITRTSDGMVTLSATLLADDFRWNRARNRTAAPSGHNPPAIYFTLDDTEPTLHSQRYAEPLALPMGGRLQARTSTDEMLGPVSRIWLGMATDRWQISTSPESPADRHGLSQAIDNDPETYWLESADRAAGEAPPTLLLDLNQVVTIAGWTYLPPPGLPGNQGLIDGGLIETSLDGTTWTPSGEFHFGNLINDRSLRTYLLPALTAARYVRVTPALHPEGRARLGAAELGILVGSK